MRKGAEMSSTKQQTFNKLWLPRLKETEEQLDVFGRAVHRSLVLCRAGSEESNEAKQEALDAVKTVIQMARYMEQDLRSDETKKSSASASEPFVYRGIDLSDD